MTQVNNGRAGGRRETWRMTLPDGHLICERVGEIKLTFVRGESSLSKSFDCEQRDGNMLSPYALPAHAILLPNYSESPKKPFVVVSSLGMDFGSFLPSVTHGDHLVSLPPAPT
jgi:hypothetical protein